MNYNCMNILKWTEAQLKYTYDVSLQEATAQELHEALGEAVMMAISCACPPFPDTVLPLPQMSPQATNIWSQHCAGLQGGAPARPM